MNTGRSNAGGPTIVEGRAQVLEGRKHDDRGATATEYAILLAFVMAVIISGITLYGACLSDWIANLTTGLPVIH